MIYIFEGTNNKLERSGKDSTLDEQTLPRVAPKYETFDISGCECVHEFPN